MKVCKPEKHNLYIGIGFIVGGIIFAAAIFFWDGGILVPVIFLAVALILGGGFLLFYFQKKIFYDKEKVYYIQMWGKRGNCPLSEITAKKRETSASGGTYNNIRLYDRNNKLFLMFNDTDYDGADGLIRTLKSKSKYRDLDMEEETLIRQGVKRLDTIERADFEFKRSATVLIVRYASIAAIVSAASPLALSVHAGRWLLLVAWIAYIGILTASSGVLFGNARTGMKNAWTILGEPQDKRLFALIAVATIVLSISMIWFAPGLNMTVVYLEFDHAKDPSILFAIGLFVALRHFFCRKSKVRTAIAVMICIFFVFVVYGFMAYDFAKQIKFNARVTGKYVYEDETYVTVRADKIKSEIRENELYMHEDRLYVYETDRDGKLLPADSMAVEVPKKAYNNYMTGDTVKVCIHRAALADDSYVEIQ